jgi:hypothetical protein
MTDPAQTKNVFKVRTKNFKFRGPYKIYAAYISITSDTLGAIDEFNHYCELSARDSESDDWRCIDLPPQTFSRGPIDVFVFRLTDTLIHVQGEDDSHRNYYRAREPVDGVEGWMSWYDLNTKLVFITYVDDCGYYMIGGVNAVLLCGNRPNLMVIFKRQCNHDDILISPSLFF